MDTKHPKYNPDFLALLPAPRAGDGAWEYFTCRDGTKLFMQYWLPEGGAADRVVVCMHGMAAHGWYYSLMADELAPAGIAVYSPDYRSHGLSEGHPGDLPDASILVSDAAEVVENVRVRHPGAKIFILGESMGGAVAVNFMIDNPGAVDGMILIAPAIKAAMKFSIREILSLPLFLLAYLLSPSWRIIKVTGNEPRGMRNPANIKYDQDDPHHLKYVSTRYLIGAKRLMDRGARDGATAITAPSLLIQGGMDTAVSADGTRQFHEKLVARDKTFKFYPEGFHCMQTDPFCTDMAATIREWVQAR